MTHDELLAKIDKVMRDAESVVWLIHHDRCCGNCTCEEQEAEATSPHKALRAVVELHKPYELQSGYIMCELGCNDEGGYAETYPCKTIQAIEKELK